MGSCPNSKHLKPKHLIKLISLKQCVVFHKCSYKCIATSILFVFLMSNYHLDAQILRIQPPEIDEDAAIAQAETLKSDFERLLQSLNAVLDDVDVNSLKLQIVNFFNSEGQTTAEIQEHLDQIVEKKHPRGIHFYLLGRNFIGYLNYELLKEFQKLTNNDVVKSQIEEYESKHNTFFLQISFSTIIKVFEQHPRFPPISVIGLPKLKVHLQAPWNNRRVYEWTAFIKMRFTWPSSLIIVDITKKCVVLTYAILPSFVSSVLRDFSNPEILSALENEGVSIELSSDLIGRENVVTPNENLQMQEESLILQERRGNKNQIQVIINHGNAFCTIVFI